MVGELTWRKRLLGLWLPLAVFLVVALFPLAIGPAPDILARRLESGQQSRGDCPSGVAAAHRVGPPRRAPGERAPKS